MPNKCLLFFSKFLSSITTMILLPKILGICGEELWLKIATVQTLAIIFSPLIQMHWTKFGGLSILGEQFRKQKILIARSLITRISALVFIAFLASFFILPWKNQPNSMLIFSSFCYACSLALTNEWFYLAQGNFGGLILNESLPRFISTLSPLLFIRNESDLTHFFFGLAIVNVLTSSLIIGKRVLSNNVQTKVNFNFMDKLKYTLLQFVGFSVLFCPVPLVSFFDMRDGFQFTLLERFFRLFMTALLPISQIAHSQILNAMEKSEISRNWAKNTRSMSMGIAILYFPTLILFLTVTESFQLISSHRILVILFAILITITFANRNVEEIFVLVLRNMKSINILQFANMICLLVLFFVSIMFKSSILMTTSLIISELFRFRFMLNRLHKSGFRF